MFQFQVLCCGIELSVSVSSFVLWDWVLCFSFEFCVVGLSFVLWD